MSTAPRLHGLMERLEETGIGLLTRQAAQEAPAPSPDGELVAELKQQHAERQTQERRRDRGR